MTNLIKKVSIRSIFHENLSFKTCFKEQLLQLLMILLVISVGIYSQFASLVNWHIIANDVNQHIYWMAQFQDPDLFKKDLLTDYAKNYQTWGFILLYYLLSFFIEPLVISKILPIVLLPLSALYIFKIVKYLTNNHFTAFFASLAFAVTPAFFNRMVGGFPRAFGFPLLLIFFYYLLKREYKKTAVVLVLQSLFYPMAFLISSMTWILSLLKFSRWKPIFERSISAYTCFVIGIFIGGSILLSKQILTYNPSLGTLVTRQQMIGQPEFYNRGRHPILPTPPLFEKTLNQVYKIRFILMNLIQETWIPFVVLIFLTIERIRKKIHIPYELLTLFLASVLLYKISDYFLMKLFLPERYVEYTVRVITFLLYMIAIHQVLTKIKNLPLKKIVQGSLLIILLPNLNQIKDIELNDYSGNKELYNFLKSLPKDSMIAAHPSLADAVPTFSQRKVFVKHELSHPWMEPYWETVKSRTFDFFKIYYSDNLDEAFTLCQANDIDYLVVDRSHFSEDYFNGRIYFEPFLSYIRKSFKGRGSFALLKISDKDKLYDKKGIFIISTDALKV